MNRLNFMKFDLRRRLFASIDISTKSISYFIHAISTTKKQCLCFTHKTYRYVEYFDFENRNHYINFLYWQIRKSILILVGNNESVSCFFFVCTKPSKIGLLFYAYPIFVLSYKYNNFIYNFFYKDLSSSPWSSYIQVSIIYLGRYVYICSIKWRKNAFDISIFL